MSQADNAVAATVARIAEATEAMNKPAKPKADARLWDKKIVKSFVKRAIDRVGVLGWDYLSPEMREGLIAKEFASILLANARHEIPGAAIQTLYRDMLDAAGLL